MSVLARRLLAASLGLLASAPAGAGVYVGGSGSFARHELLDEQPTSVGAKVYAGWRWRGLQLELEGLDAGEAEFGPDASGQSVHFSGFNASVGYFGLLPDANGSGLWLRAGYYGGELETDATGVPATESDRSGVSLGGGADWMFLPWLGLRADIAWLFGAADRPRRDEAGDVGMVSLGLIAHFGNRAAMSSTLPLPAAAAPPPPVQQAQLPPAQPAPAAAPPPVMVAPRAPPRTGPAFLRIDSALRTQPRADAPVEARFAAGTRVDAKQAVMSTRMERWWYVHAGTVTGWIAESELDFAPR